jgi:hypothetical protein
LKPQRAWVRARVSALRAHARAWIESLGKGLH